ncbi:alpha-L-arabinofuranosidase [Salegentibacter sp. LM13S]|uniref:alpha-L-arabinofuranosidase C-terminal domain-containing protein n=1 Tax=Salegentibacter lacus TaxID=2873599 RepID=UPI001CCD3137|nr:alpha-L-arabinofuranosidase C-terminal domain-containing protein [Salegentibacter lacus]MBZ9629526.1 alpha-L-arabinofuranosidase [Salegentibacter lacus]
MRKDIKNLGALLFLFSAFAGFAQQTTLQVDTENVITEIEPTMYGIFFEDINFAADGGLYAEMIKNRSFEFDDPKMGWEEPNSDRHSFNENSGISRAVKYASDSTRNYNYMEVSVNDADGYEMINEGFRGMGVKEGENYRFSLMASQPGEGIKRINLQLIGENGEVVGETSISLDFSDWKLHESTFEATGTAEKAKARITFEGTGKINLDMVSLFPEDTWKGRKNGLRKDLVQLLDDMDPGFLRFPGGCIVEGRTLAQRYQWKKTVGPVEEREILINRWNTEFDHRPAPDYFQSFGLGFFEYFQLAEDMGAEPLPILSCGIACQFNTGELVPMEELEPYIQDALDLIEFANGSTDTSWGKVRRDMGHPEPFDMKYIGVGNEQWGPEYIERYLQFEKAIKEKYPDMIIISGSGPFAEGDYFEYGWDELEKTQTEIIDEHYYKSPEWFRKNADRYDDYDRNGPKVFAGEYAAQTVAIASPDNKNNWNTALSEAAYMTGLERNADVVTLTSYAPLMAHKEGWQWTPDMIWFDNLESYGTPNYYVQKLFATNSGTDLISVTQNEKDLTGQEGLYASAVKDKNKKEIIVKLVNTSGNTKEVILDFNGNKLNKNGTILTLKNDDLEAENSFEAPKNISPKEGKIRIKRDKAGLDLPAQSVSILKIKMN